MFLSLFLPWRIEAFATVLAQHTFVGFGIALREIAALSSPNQPQKMPDGPD
jgi:hypothetical protein